jgi:hypothetical protein
VTCARLAATWTCLLLSSSALRADDAAPGKDAAPKGSSAEKVAPEKTATEKIAAAKVAAAGKVKTGAAPTGKVYAAVTESERLGAYERGVQYLLRTQNPDGSWGSPRKTKGLNITADIASHHGFHVGSTALDVMALCEAEKNRPAVTAALEKAEKWLFEALPRLKRGNPIEIYNVWSHSYGIRALVALRGRPGTDDAKKQTIDRLVREQITLLDKFESVDGGWGYYDFRAGSAKPATDSTSFVNATALVALYEAKKIGVAPPEKLVSRAVAATLRQRKPDFSYLYGEYLKMRPMLGINRPGGSLGRSQACNLALRLWGDRKVDDAILTTWLQRFFDRHLWLDIGRKRPIPHESWMQVAGYFFYYGHYYASLCIDQLPARERKPFQDKMARVLIDRQEKDGSWFDFELYDYHQAYGTGYALLALGRCKTE